MDRPVRNLGFHCCQDNKYFCKPGGLATIIYIIDQTQTPQRAAQRAQGSAGLADAGHGTNSLYGQLGLVFVLREIEQQGHQCYGRYQTFLQYSTNFQMHSSVTMGK